WSGAAARIAMTSPERSPGVREMSTFFTILAPEAVSTLFTFWQARCISGALRQIRPNFFGLITSRTHSAPALASLIIDMWDGRDQGPIHGVWVRSRSSLVIGMLDHVTLVRRAKIWSCSTSFFMHALAREVSPGPSSQSMYRSLRP